MPDDVVVAAGAPPAEPPAAPAVQPAAPIVQVAPTPTPAPVPDGVTLTRRELEAHVEKAVARAVEAVQSKAMPDKNPEDPKNPLADEVAKLREETKASIEALKAEAAAKTAALEAQLAEANKRADESAQKAEDEKKARRRAKEKVVEANLRKSAAKAGIEDEDYALVLYARDASARVNAKDAEGNPAPQQVQDPDEFFAALGKTKPGLLRAAPPAPRASTAPADNGNPPPPPAPPGKASTAEGNPDKTAFDKDHREFSADTLTKYGYNPSVPY